MAAMAGGMATIASAATADAQPRKPFKIYGNTYYVGSAGHASLLVVSDYGFVLIDTGPKEIAAQVAANIKELGFKLAELKAILVSDARPEHSGGALDLQQLSGAQIYTRRPGDQKLRNSKPLKNDPREGVSVGSIPLIPQAWVVQDDQLVSSSAVRARVLATPGGAPEGISWAFDACDGSKCIPTVYAASLEPDGKAKKSAETQQAVEASLKRLEGASCQLVLTPRPADSGGLDRLVKAAGKQEALKTDGACKAYVQQLRSKLAR
jgi:metallo-beta-lactamase class B